MSQVKSKDTKPELVVRKYLFSKGFRYKLHDPKLPGKPDIVLPKFRTVIFVNGCFWHGHKNCRYFVIPKTSTRFWVSKIERNKTRDIQNISKLKQQGWQIITVFECQLKPTKKTNTLNRVLKLLNTSINKK